MLFFLTLQVPPVVMDNKQPGVVSGIGYNLDRIYMCPLRKIV